MGRDDDERSNPSSNDKETEQITNSKPRKVSPNDSAEHDDNRRQTNKEPLTADTNPVHKNRKRSATDHPATAPTPILFVADELAALVKESVLDCMKNTSAKRRKTSPKPPERPKDFRLEGHRKQYDFVESVLDKVRKANTLIDEGYSSSAQILLTESATALNHRLIAVNSEAGWSTVDEYKRKIAGDDSGDEKRIKSAEQTALRKKKERFSKTVRFSRPASQETPAPLGWPSSPFRTGAPLFPCGTSQTASPSNIPNKKRSASVFDQCYTCGGQGHWTIQCGNRFNVTGALTVSRPSTSRRTDN